MRALCRLNTPKLLGYLGLLPFIAITLAMGLASHYQAFYKTALLSYGAVILTFVGALHWAIAMQARDVNPAVLRHHYLWSVLPSLAAWVALLLPYVYGVSLLVLFFTLALWRDCLLARLIAVPDWYLPLRKNLTLVVTICLLMATFI